MSTPLESTHCLMNAFGGRIVQQDKYELMIVTNAASLYSLRLLHIKKRTLHSSNDNNCVLLPFFVATQRTIMNEQFCGILQGSISRVRYKQISLGFLFISTNSALLWSNRGLLEMVCSVTVLLHYP